jgi:hypothetical protein
MLETAFGVGLSAPGESIMINLFHLDFFGERGQRIDLELPRLARPGLSRHWP